MAKINHFIVRIELHGSSANYHDLHDWMAKAGYSRTIVGETGKRMQLPTGMYAIDSYFDAAQQRDWLEQALPWCGSSAQPWVLAIEWNAWAIHSQQVKLFSGVTAA